MIFSTVIVMIAMVVLGYFIAKNEAAVQPNPNGLLLKSVSDNQSLFESLKKVKEERALKEEKREAELALKRKKQQEAAQREAAQKKAALQALEKEKQQKDLEKKKVVTYPAEVVKVEEVISVSEKEKPKLVIIIDDVSSRSQLAHIRATGLKLTPSIFPPYGPPPITSSQKAQNTI
ncbi:divergent polysaccharide deacetylase family protein [Sulfurovum mangrovi]|uniref:hypothetical protein n=1 Tax=Sulfurovum mangrovi TaxID=2893889 RepID=UPI001E39B6EB|nr:hypothetical protein [Sulfurovum mangrovi]UFH60812.1 hypothetical protein LN246_14775 [Sulfurovum mangrovi]